MCCPWTKSPPQLSDLTHWDNKLSSGLTLCTAFFCSSSSLCAALRCSSFSFCRRFFSPGPQRWQKEQAGPFSQPLVWRKAQGLQRPARWPADPMLGSSAEPGAGPAGGDGGNALLILSVPRPRHSAALTLSSVGAAYCGMLSRQCRGMLEATPSWQEGTVGNVGGSAIGGGAGCAGLARLVCKHNLLQAASNCQGRTAGLCSGAHAVIKEHGGPWVRHAVLIELQ
jgi:hypothetical protein